MNPLQQLHNSSFLQFRQEHAPEPNAALPPEERVRDTSLLNYLPPLLSNDPQHEKQEEWPRHIANSLPPRSKRRIEMDDANQVREQPSSSPLITAPPIPPKPFFEHSFLINRPVHPIRLSMEDSQSLSPEIKKKIEALFSEFRKRKYPPIDSQEFLEFYNTVNQSEKNPGAFFLNMPREIIYALLKGNASIDKKIQFIEGCQKYTSLDPFNSVRTSFPQTHREIGPTNVCNLVQLMQFHDSLFSDGSVRAFERFRYLRPLPAFKLLKAPAKLPDKITFLENLENWLSGQKPTNQRIMNLIKEKLGSPQNKRTYGLNFLKQNASSSVEEGKEINQTNPYLELSPYSKEPISKKPRVDPSSHQSVPQPQNPMPSQRIDTCPNVALFSPGLTEEQKQRLLLIATPPRTPLTKIAPSLQGRVTATALHNPMVVFSK